MKHLFRKIRFLGLYTFGFISTIHAGNPGSIDTAHYYLKHSYDVQNYKLDIDIYPCFTSPFPKSFTAKEIIRFRVDSSLQMISLNADNNSLQIDSVRMAGISFTHARDTLNVLLNRVYQPGETVKVTVYYKHKDTADHAFYAGGGQVFFDFPAEGARHCFPCWDRPSDKAKWELTAKVPRNVRLGSNGTLADSLIKGDTLYYHWVSRDPMSTYLMTLTARIDYNIGIKYWHKQGKPKDSIPVRFYYKITENPIPFEIVIQPMTDFYSRMFGEYPFEKIGFATLNGLFQWGGMENQTMINLQMNGWREGLISHEFAHQWFGDLVTCGTWADIWLNESFATYCESLWLEHTRGYAAYHDHLKTQATTYLDGNPGFPIYNSLWAIQTPPVNLLYTASVIYDKGACVLHQLRYVLGDSAFFHVLHAYMTDTTFQFKNAVTMDFIAKVKQVTGKDYSWFFKEWIYAPDHPVYKNTFEIFKSGKKKWTVKYTVEQKQLNARFFQMPIEMRVGFSNKSDTLIKVDNIINNQTFEFLFSKCPITIVFDPFENILLRNTTTTVNKVKRKKDGKTSKTDD